MSFLKQLTPFFDTCLPHVDICIFSIFSVFFFIPHLDLPKVIFELQEESLKFFNEKIKPRFCSISLFYFLEKYTALISDNSCRVALLYFARAFGNDRFAEITHLKNSLAVHVILFLNCNQCLLLVIF